MQSIDNFNLESGSLIITKCQCGKDESMEYYRVLGIFRKYYNKWFVSIESGTNMWEKFSNKYNTFERLMQENWG